MRKAFFAPCLALVSVSVLAAADKTYRVVTVTVDAAVRQPLENVDTVVQVGTNPVDRFTMHHVYRKHGTIKGTIILVPSALSNFNQYMLGEDHGKMRSLAESLARAHYDVYGYSPRTAHVPPMGCSSGVVDCSVMRDWGFDAYLRDIEYIRAHAAARGEKPVIGGLSLGAILGLAAVNANPTGYSGLLMWEGMIYSNNPALIALSAQNCAGLRAAISAGAYYDENTPSLLKQLAQIGEAATIPFFGVPQPALSGTPDWIQLVPDPTMTRYEFASFPRVFDFVMALNNVESLVMARDFQCSLAGDRTYSSRLGSFRGPVLAIEGGRGSGPYMQDTINLLGSTKVRVESDQSFGHLDAYLTSHYTTYTVQRILDWLREDVFRNGRGNQ